MSGAIPIRRPQELLAKIAESQIGLTESPIGSNTGPALRKFFEADDLIVGGKTDGYPWCASFVSWCVQEYFRKLGLEAPRIRAPRTAAAFGFEDWARANGVQIIPGAALKVNRPLRGDIVVFKISHIGIASSCHLEEPILSTTDGNTNKAGGREGFEVATKPRTFDQVRSIIRLPALALPV